MPFFIKLLFVALSVAVDLAGLLESTHLSYSLAIRMNIKMGNLIMPSYLNSSPGFCGCLFYYELFGRLSDFCKWWQFLSYSLCSSHIGLTPFAISWHLHVLFHLISRTLVWLCRVDLSELTFSGEKTDSLSLQELVVWRHVTGAWWILVELNSLVLHKSCHWKI